VILGIGLQLGRQEPSVRVIEARAVEAFDVLDAARRTKTQALAGRERGEVRSQIGGEDLRARGVEGLGSDRLLDAIGDQQPGDRIALRRVGRVLALELGQPGLLALARELLGEALALLAARSASGRRS